MFVHIKGILNLIDYSNKAFILKQKTNVNIFNKQIFFFKIIKLTKFSITFSDFSEKQKKNFANVTDFVVIFALIELYII